MSWVKPAADAILAAGESLMVEVNASDPDGTIANVKLYLDNKFVRQENYAPYQWGAAGQNDPLLNDLSAGSHTLKAVATDDDGAATTITRSFTVTGDYLTIPGIIEAEDYREGGEAVAYHDTTSGNTGGAYRSDDVDIQKTGDTTGTYNVGWVAAGEWLTYAVKVEKSGSYTIRFRVASQMTSNKTLHLELDGKDITGPVSFNTQGKGWQVYQTEEISGVQLEAGVHILKLVMDTAAFNINYMEFIFGD
ncbi:MAG: carbohydrate-binding protein [Lentisphaerae bacterium]|nr:MAG: carbohydrate-binding protein [Lentisphaerota bacterium]